MYSLVVGVLFLFTDALSLEASVFTTRHTFNWKQTPCPNKAVVSSYQGPVPHFDWRQCGGVSPVKDQGQCGDCWAFSAIANIESQYWIQGLPFIFSEQFLLDCNNVGGTCNNDTSVVSTFADIISHFGGVPLASDYRSYQQKKLKCPDEMPPMKNVAGMQRVRPGDEEGMAKALREYGPLSAGINDIMMTKHRDPMAIDDPTEEQCPPNIKNHAVLIVGYSYAFNPDGSPVPYWIIKNSWGVNGWSGDHGYYYLRRGTNACGIATDVSYATV